MKTDTSTSEMNYLESEFRRFSLIKPRKQIDIKVEKSYSVTNNFSDISLYNIL